MKARLCAAALVLSLAACATAPAPPAPPAVEPAVMLAAVRAAAGDGDGELAVQPLRDPQVEDLRQAAQRFQTEGRHAEAAQALDRALALTPEDPAVLQERAEVALLLRRFDQAEALARRAFELGARVGPLCRRHWATVREVRRAQGDTAAADEAHARLIACRVAPPERF